MAMCTSPLIAPCDQDDIWHPRKLAILADAIGDADMAYCDSAYIDEAGRPLNRRISDDLGPMHAGHDALRYAFQNTVSGHAMLVRRPCSTARGRSPKSSTTTGGSRCARRAARAWRMSINRWCSSVAMTMRHRRSARMRRQAEADAAGCAFAQPPVVRATLVHDAGDRRHPLVVAAQARDWHDALRTGLDSNFRGLLN